MALLLQHRVPCDNFEQYARSRVRVAGLATGWGADDCRHRPGGSVGNVGGRHEIAMMKNRYSKETGHYHWRCCVASDDVEGQGSSSGEGRGGEGEGRMRRSMRNRRCRIGAERREESRRLEKRGTHSSQWRTESV